MVQLLSVIVMVQFVSGKGVAANVVTCIALAFLLGTPLACNNDKSSAKSAQADNDDASTKRDPAASAAKSSPSSTSSAKPITPKKPKVTAPDCIAKTKGKQASVGALGSSLAAMKVSAGTLYLLAHQPMNARAILSKLARKGGKPAEVGRHTDGGIPASLVIGDSAAFFTMRGKVVKMSLTDKGVETIASKFPKNIALHGGKVYGVRCPKKKKTYELVRVSQKGGEVEVVATWDRKAGKKCRISSVAVNQDNAIVADWQGRRLIRVALEDGQTKVLAKGYPFPQNIILDGDSFLFQSSRGVFRIAQAGGEAKKISSSGISPFHTVASNDTDLYIIAEDAYASSGAIERVPLAGGETKKLTAWRVRGDLGSGIKQIGADDQCVYYAKTQSDYTSITARLK